MPLFLHNSLSGHKEQFTPLDENHIRMYVCGPTVYDRPHIGNARAVVVYDVLYRLLQHLYPEDQAWQSHMANNASKEASAMSRSGGQRSVRPSRVTYARNITDVDDKINAAAKKNGEPIATLTERVTGWFHNDMAALGNLPPTIEPRATEEIATIIILIQNIINNNHAYESKGHILFNVNSVETTQHYHYGKLSGKKLQDLIAGARVEVEDYKRHPGDFVLWKPSSDDEPGWDSPWGRGRPGWHIECSAMSTKYLGTDFDIHGGGADLKFPHHENEIAQSCCGYPGSSFARYWIHNGFLTVNGEKMSKSLGNFTTVNELLERGIKGEVIRYVLLSSHYRKPLDFSEKQLKEAEKSLNTLYSAVQKAQQQAASTLEENAAITERSHQARKRFLAALQDDLNTPLALSELYTMAKGLRSLHCAPELLGIFQECCALLGIVQQAPESWLTQDTDDVDDSAIEALIAQRSQAKADKNWAAADRIRDELAAQGIQLEDSPTGTSWRKV